MDIEKYKQLLRQLDEFDRQNAETGADTPERDAIIDQFDDWNNWTDEERKEIEQLNVALYEEWTPEQKYLEACRILRTWPATCPEKHKLFWENRRDKAHEEMKNASE